jgi:hypothetical protein
VNVYFKRLTLFCGVIFVNINPGEFFAVATETIFEKPPALKAPASTPNCKKSYQLDPASWLCAVVSFSENAAFAGLSLKSHCSDSVQIQPLS